MTALARAPHPALASLVGPYVGYDDTLDPGLVHHGVPSVSVTVVLSFDEPLDAGWLATRGPSDTSRTWAMVSGLHLRPALVLPHGRQHGIQLSLTPWGCRRVLGVPAGAVAGEIVDLGDAGLGLGRVEHERLAGCRTWEGRFALLDEVLLCAAARPRRDAEVDVVRAWHRLSGPGRVPVGAVAAELGRSPRWLSSRVGAELGVPPVAVARLHRFERATALARTGRPLADVAAVTGYADQAHLSREWKALSGLTPTALLASTYRFLHDDERPAPAR